MSADIQPHTWPRRRWLAIILIILTGQVAFIFWLGARHPVPVATINFGPALFLSADSRTEWPGLSDPTRYILPNRRGFSGDAWLKVPPRDYTSSRWTDPPPATIAPPLQKLGAAVDQFVRTNLNRDIQLAPKSEPLLDFIPPTVDAEATQSMLTIQGGLAQRPLLSQLKLPSWPSSEILTNSEVLAGVDHWGNVFSAVLLNSSGSKIADASALNLAASARFQSVREPGTNADNRLRWGKIIFHWHTVPLPATNAPPNL